MRPIHLLQLAPGADKAANLRMAESMLRQADPSPGSLLALPEVWTCLGGDGAAKAAAAEELPIGGADSVGPAYTLLREAARRRQVFVHGGSVVERDGPQLFNTTVVFDPGGNEVARYRKIHLFDVTTPDGLGYRESAQFGGGGELATFDWNGLRVGCAICYDLRFPELFGRLRDSGAELLVVPAAFTRPTGEAHWSTLLRARAIETQCWVAAPATCGTHADAAGQPRGTWGHSTLCDPWGRVVAEAGDGPEVLSAAIDGAVTAKVRADMPVWSHRRLR